MMDENENVIPLWWDLQSGMQSPGAEARFELSGGEDLPFAVFGGRSTLSGWQCNYEEYLNAYSDLQAQQSAVAIELDYTITGDNNFAINATISMENNLITEDNRLFFLVTSDTVRIDVSVPGNENDRSDSIRQNRSDSIRQNRSDSEWSYRVLAVSDYLDFDLSWAGETANYTQTFEIPELEFVDVEDYQAIAIIQGFSDGKMVQAERVSLGSTSISENEVNQSKLKLSNYPNPFNPATKISYEISAEINLESVRIDIYNLKGELIKSFPELNRGKGVVYWNGKDNTGVAVSSGIYFYKLKAGSASSMQKMILLK